MWVREIHLCLELALLISVILDTFWWEMSYVHVEEMDPVGLENGTEPSLLVLVGFIYIFVSLVLDSNSLQLYCVATSVIL